MDIIEGSLLTAARGHSLAAVSALDSTPAFNAKRLSHGKNPNRPYPVVV